MNLMLLTGRLDGIVCEDCMYRIEQRPTEWRPTAGWRCLRLVVRSLRRAVFAGCAVT